MNEETRRIKNKCHLLTFFIVNCEEEDPLEEDENEWHPDFEETIQSILKLNEEGYLPEDQLHRFNDLFNKWSNRFEKLGLDEVPLQKWKEEDKLEDEIFDLLKEYVQE